MKMQHEFKELFPAQLIGGPEDGRFVPVTLGDVYFLVTRNGMTYSYAKDEASDELRFRYLACQAAGP